MIRHLALTASLSLVVVSATYACDSTHDWGNVSVIQRKLVSPRALDAMVASVLEHAGTAGRVAPGSVVAVTMSDDTTGDGKARTVFPAIAGALASRGLKAIGPDEVVATLGPGSIGAGGILTPGGFETLQKSRKATLFLRIQVTSGGQEVSLFRDSTPERRDFHRESVTEIVRGRATLQDANGQFLFIGECNGTAREEWMFSSAVGPERVDKILEYSIDRPGQPPRTFRAPGISAHE